MNSQRKKHKSLLVLLVPCFIVEWFSGGGVRAAPGGFFSQLVFGLLPYAFSAALSMRKDSDCRLLKYYLPYGKMKKFVRAAYGMRVGNDMLDNGLVGWFRKMAPYGLVLWWDAQNGSRGGSHAVAKGTPFGNGAGARRHVDELQELARLDRIEVLQLRALINSQGRDGVR